MDRIGTTIWGGGGGRNTPAPPGAHTECSVSLLTRVTLRRSGGRYPCGLCSIRQNAQNVLWRAAATLSVALRLEAVVVHLRHIHAAHTASFHLLIQRHGGGGIHHPSAGPPFRVVAVAARILQPDAGVAKHVGL